MTVSLTTISFNQGILTVLGAPIEVTFQGGNDQEFMITCPESLLCKVSEYFKTLCNAHWKNDPIQVSHLNPQAKYFQFLSDYINEGELRIFDAYSLQELKDLYDLCHFLQIDHLITHLSDVLNKKINSIKNDYNAMRDHFCFGIKRNSRIIINYCLPKIISDCLIRVNNSSDGYEHYTFVRFSLIKEASGCIDTSTKIIRVACNTFRNYRNEGRMLWVANQLLEIFPNAEEIHSIEIEDKLHKGLLVSLEKDADGSIVKFTALKRNIDDF